MPNAWGCNMPVLNIRAEWSLRIELRARTNVDIRRFFGSFMNGVQQSSGHTLPRIGGQESVMAYGGFMWAMEAT
jgi:hypothetical protein